jgi:antitoxin component of MazEF toxin-antitoxin module
VAGTQPCPSLLEFSATPSEGGAPKALVDSMQLSVGDEINVVDVIGRTLVVEKEVNRRGVTYAQLPEKLAAISVVDSERNLNNKISRGGFSGAFMLQCLEAIGCRSLQLSDG